jgi:class 3 adenylate cyclase
MEIWARKIFEDKIKVQTARSRSGELLTEMFPEHIAEKLVSMNHKQESPLSLGMTEVIADTYTEMIIMCSDICGFTKFSSSVKPSQVVQLVTELFAEFDHMTYRLNIFKVCTIGDAYVAVTMPKKRPLALPGSKDASKTLKDSKVTPDSRRGSGGVGEALLQDAEEDLPLKLQSQALDAHHMFELGYGMRDHITKVRDKLGIPELGMRIGIHRGDFVGGVIGSDRLRFDIWGVDVVTAQMSESHGKPNQLNVTTQMRDFLDDCFGSRFVYEPNCTMSVPGNKEVETFLVVDRCFETKW